MMNGGYSKMKIASVAAVIAVGLWATDADAGHRWRRGGGHRGGHHNHCHNYSGSSHGNVVIDCGDAYNDCGQTSNWQGGSCGDNHGYAEHSSGYGSCGSHGSHSSAYHGQSNYYGQSGHYGQYQPTPAGQAYETMRPEGQQGVMYGDQEMAPPPPPSYDPQDGKTQGYQRQYDDRNNNNSDAERNRDGNERNDNADSNRDDNSDNRDGDNDRDDNNRDENDSTGNTSATNPTSDTPAAQL
jgi:hypothetical protein